MDLEGIGRGLILKDYPGIRLERLKKITKTEYPVSGMSSEPGPPNVW
jgi:hypothetical protein